MLASVRSRGVACGAMCALSGGALALVAPGTDLLPLAWVGLAGLACALGDEARRPREPSPGPRELTITRAWLEGGARGLAFGVGANVVGLRFVPAVIARFTPLPFAAGVVALVLLAGAQAIPWALGGMVTRALRRAQVPGPLAFAIGVYAATFVPSVFPWTPAGLLAKWPTLVQLAEAVGERGVTALVAFSAGFLAQAVRVAWRGGRGRAITCAGLAIAIPLGMAIEGKVRIRAIDALRARAPTASIGLVDARIPATTRWEAAAAPGILAELTRLTISAEARGAEITIWPEAAYPYTLPRGSKAGPPGLERILQHGVRGPLLVGMATRDAARGDEYNAAIVVRPDGGLAAEYDKLHLLWFGEEVPLATELPWLRRTFARGLGMIPGDRPVRLDLGRVKVGALICFEDTLPDAGREAASVAPNLLVNMTNDAWFAGSEEPAIHLRFAAMRAIEARRDLVRAVNVGPATLVDAAGRVREASASPIPASLVVTAALLDGGPTVYARFGDWPWLFTCTLVAAIFAAMAGKAAATDTKRSERPTT